ncbi:MAG TPA: FtsX-like permease family protein, partial [Symbiobacteriaceae bacterium]|nr:FtsX-like permease family protein [Symbiobacteriaceae bacterium]
VVRAAWESEILEMSATGEPTAMAYHEPPFGPMQGLPGVEAEARVQTRRDVSFKASTRNLGKADLMGIEPREFGLAARFQPDLIPDPAAALNALAADEQAVLVSADMAGRLSLKPGDRLQAVMGDSTADFTVAGIVSYWPGRLPEGGEFVVGNLAYLQDMLGLAPYEVWLRLSPDAGAADVVTALAQRSVKLAEVSESAGQIAAGRREPFRLGIYATLSTGFLVALAALVLTYLLSSTLTLKARAKEMGILRAMGMSARQVALALYTEQLTIVAGAAAAGLTAGTLTAAAYIPVFRQQPGESLLPLRTSGIAGDRLTMLALLALTLAVGAAVAASGLRRLNIGAVLRLGEDG